jgi:hypothetical protein
MMYTFISWQRTGLVQKDVYLASRFQVWVWRRSMSNENKSYIVLENGVPLYWCLQGDLNLDGVK